MLTFYSQFANIHAIDKNAYSPIFLKKYYTKKRLSKISHPIHVKFIKVYLHRILKFNQERL